MFIIEITNYLYLYNYIYIYPFQYLKKSCRVPSRLLHLLVVEESWSYPQIYFVIPAMIHAPCIWIIGKSYLTFILKDYGLNQMSFLQLRQMRSCGNTGKHLQPATDQV